jgi:hypothetical protein
MNERTQQFQTATLESNLKDQLILECVHHEFTLNKYHELARAVINLIGYIERQIEGEDHVKSLFIRNIIIALHTYLSEVGDNQFKSRITYLIETYQTLFKKKKNRDPLQIYVNVHSKLTDVFSEITKNKESAQESLMEVFEQYYALVCVNIPLIRLFDGHGFIAELQGALSLNKLHNQLKANQFLKPIVLAPRKKINNKQLNILVDYLIEYPISAPLKINLSCCNIKSEGVQVLARYLTSGKTPENLTLWLYDNQIDDKGAGYLADAIGSGKTSANLAINLKKNHIDVKGVQLLSMAIQSKKAMPGLTLFFNEDEDCAFSDLSVKALAESVQSQYAPHGLKLSLFNLSNTGVEYLATAIRSGHAPLNLSISIGNITEISEIGVITLIQAVGSGRAPEGTALKLSPVDINGKLGEEVVKLIEQGNAPNRLNLTLVSLKTKVDPFVNLLIKALETGKGPKGLAIDLELTKIKDKTKNDLLALLVSGKCPAGFQLSADSWLDGDEPFQKAIAALLMKETSIIINYNGSAKDNVCLQRIKFCSLRNKLILCFPEFENFIKKISIDAGLYNPTNTFINPLSLKISSAFSFISNKNDVPQTLPSKILEYIKQLAQIHGLLSDNIPKFGPVFG